MAEYDYADWLTKEDELEIAPSIPPSICYIEHLYMSQSERYALLTVGSSVVLLAVVLNALILGAFWRSPHIRTAPNLYILNLTVCDLMLGLCNLPTQLTLDYRGCWPYSPLLCHAAMMFGWTLGQEMAVTMVLIAYDRYLMVKLGLSYSSSETSAVVTRRLAITWLLNTLLYIPCHLVQFFTGFSLATGGECTPEFYQVPVLREAVFLWATFLSPLLLALLYGMLYAALRRQSASLPPGVNADRYVVRNRKAAKSMTILTGVFLCTWMPMGVVGIVQLAIEEDQEVWRKLRRITVICNYLLLSNAVINPLLYAYAFPGIRQAMLDLVVPSAWRSTAGELTTTSRVNETSAGVSLHRADLPASSSMRSHLGSVASSHLLYEANNSMEMTRRDFAGYNSLSVTQGRSRIDCSGNGDEKSERISL